MNKRIKKYRDELLRNEQRIAELKARNKELGKLILKEEDLEIAWRHYENQLEEINRIKGIIEQQKRFNQERNYITIASKEKQIERLEADLVKPQTLPKKLRFAFRCTDPVTDEIMTAKNLSVGFDGEKLFGGVDIEVRKGERVFLLGANGSGKTTLFRILMKQLAPETGNVIYGPAVRAGYYDQLMTGLSDEKTVMDEIWDAYPKMSQTQVRTALGSFLFGKQTVDGRLLRSLFLLGGLSIQVLTV